MSIDAYAHIGYPRYGTVEELLSIWRQWGIEKGNIALAPGVPDFNGLRSAREQLGDKVRLFGIPYGEDERTRLDLASLQVEFGISGMRLMPKEILDNPRILDLLGDAGLCLMAINVYDDARVTRAMLDWLEEFPKGTIAAPHFLKPATIAGGAADPDTFRELLLHPRMHAVFSRHGGCSGAPYPHEDLRPWVEEVVSLLSWNRVLWGSEIPVIYHRDEQVDAARDWLSNLGVRMTDTESEAYLAGNADRLFFSRPAPSGGNVEFPASVDEGMRAFVEANAPVPVVRTDDLHMPLDLHGRLMSEYIRHQFNRPGDTFQQYLVHRLRRAMEHVGQS